MTDRERQLVKQAAHSVIAATSTYCELLEKRMKQSDGSAEQMPTIFLGGGAALMKRHVGAVDGLFHGGRLAGAKNLFDGAVGTVHESRETTGILH